MKQQPILFIGDSYILGVFENSKHKKLNQRRKTLIKIISFTLFLLGLSTWLLAQDKIELKQDTKAGIYIIQAGPYIPPVDTCSNPCKDGNTPTVTVGTTTVVPPTQAPKAIGVTTPTGVRIDFELPSAYPPPTCPSCPSSGGTQIKGLFDVTSYGAKGDGNTDDRAAFQAAIDAARSAKGTVVIPPASSFYRINSTINVTPDASNQIWININAKGRAGEIRFFGSNQPCFKVIGLKGGQWDGLNISLQGSNSQAVDVTTTQSANSSSFNTFRNFYIDLGKGQNNVGIRTGYQSPGDISNYNFENMVVFGGATSGTTISSISGQYAFQNLGVNTLSMVWYGGFVAFCDRAYSNRSVDGSQRGNGSAMFYGLGGSQNNIDFEFAWEQAYIISGGRWEGGNKFLRVSDGAYSSILADGLVIHDYKTDNQIEVQVACSLTLKGVQISKTYGGVFNNCVSLSSPRIGVLNMQNCAFSCNQPYQKSGAAMWDITSLGNIKLNGVWSEAFFNNEVGIRK